MYNQAIESLPLEQLRKLQNTRLTTLVHRLYRDVAFYKKRGTLAYSNYLTLK